MYRVAAVAATLFDAHELADYRDELISACLLHDMGNIVKFNFDALLIVSPDERNHWEVAQKKMIAQYGTSAHKATLAIVDAIGVSSRVREIVDGVDFSNCEKIAESNDVLLMMAQYADARVTPNGIASLDERMEDMLTRYAHKHNRNDEETMRQIRALENIEQQLFTGLLFTPSDITEDSTQLMREELKNFVIC